MYGSMMGRVPAPAVKPSPVGMAGPPRIAPAAMPQPGAAAMASTMRPMPGMPMRSTGQGSPNRAAIANALRTVIR